MTYGKGKNIVTGNRSVFMAEVGRKGELQRDPKKLSEVMDYPTS